MSGTGDDRDTLASETALASGDTLQADAATPIPTPSSGNVIRSGRASQPRGKLGRYTLRGLRGRGGMGEVYEADDPELGRRVAIKVLREGRGDTQGLLREAQALARLVHPNVITVHDVGTEEGSVFLVMQLVDGESIDRWLAARHATPRAIVAAFRQAGLGLAAAHAAGLVHCDFKPSNVLVDRDGVVRVGDFGLARGAGEHGQVAGTPAYMAPEQFAGRATPASDQFAFCVALWEVIAGEPPFERTSLEDGAEHAATRPRRAMPRGKRVPARVVRALERGLAIDPAQRFASMQELLAALAPRGRQGLAIAAGATVAAGAVAAIAVLGHGSAPPAAPAVAGPPPAPRLDVARAHPVTQLGATACAYAPAFAHDGQIVFDRTERDAVDLYAIAPTGGVPRQLTSDAATWEWRSSRGRTPGEIVHLIQDPRSHDHAAIAALDLATGRDTHLVDVFAHDAAAAGDSIFYIPLTQLAIRRWRGDQDVAVLTSSTLRFRQLAAAPAGDHLAVVAVDAATPRLCLVDVASARLDCVDGKIRSSRPAFGADGRNVYYTTADGIRRRELATGRDELVVPDARAIGGLAVAPDGSALVYSECGSRSPVIDATTSQVVIADPTAAQPVVSRDGTIAWTREVRGVRVLVARKQDGRELQLSTPDLGGVNGIAFSPDGTRIAFVVGAPHAGIHVSYVTADSQLSEVTASPRDAFPVWLDDHQLAFARFDEANRPGVYTVAADGGEPRRLGTASRTVHGIRGGSLLVASTQRMFWMDAKTGVEHDGPPHPDSASFATLSPSGTWVAYEAGEAGQEVWRMSLAPGGKLERVLTLPTGQTATALAITDDGRVLIAPESWSGDLVAVPAAGGTRL